MSSTRNLKGTPSPCAGSSNLKRTKRIKTSTLPPGRLWWRGKSSPSSWHGRPLAADWATTWWCRCTRARGRQGSNGYSSRERLTGSPGWRSARALHKRFAATFTRNCKDHGFTDSISLSLSVLPSWGTVLIGVSQRAFVRVAHFG